MLKLLTIIGARPQIIKAAALSRAIRNHYADKVQEVIVHTGQHYDQNMSEVFFQELNIPQPDYNLGVGSCSHGEQTAKMIQGIEGLLLNEKPDFIVLYGDTNSTLAGAIAASKIHIPIIHIEAGLRSFNKRMPEEINRILCDHASTYLFSPTMAGIQNLEGEGFSIAADGPYSADRPGVFHSGDVMYDNSMYFAELSEKHQELLKKLSIEAGKYILATVHRNDNTDSPERLSSIFKALCDIAKQTPVVLPLHPRTKKLLDSSLSDELNHKLQALQAQKQLQILPPLAFLQMTFLEKHAKMIVTDSGGVQKEAFFFQKPGIILRPETEWVEIIEQNAAILADADYQKIMDAFQFFSNNPYPETENVFGSGMAAKEMLELVIG